MTKPWLLVLEKQIELCRIPSLPILTQSEFLAVPSEMRVQLRPCGWEALEQAEFLNIAVPDPHPEHAVRFVVV